MHLCFVPLTEDGRLSAKDIMGNKKKLTWWQDEFWKHMVKKFPDLGVAKVPSLTGANSHSAPRVQGDDPTEQTEGQAGGSAHWNQSLQCQSRAEEICKILDTYIPSVEKMDTMLRKYGVAFNENSIRKQKLKTKNAELEESLCIGAEGQHPKADRRPQAAARLMTVPWRFWNRYRQKF